MTTRIPDRILDGYLGAFKLAHPALTLPDVIYENGWYVFRARGSGRVLRRRRASQLIEMTCRIAEYARDAP